MSYLTLLARIIAKPGCEKQLLPELEAMVQPSRNEDGCLKYVLHRLPGNDSEFWFVEEWKSESALADHNATPHYVRLKERTASLVDKVELVRLDPVI